MSSLPLFQPPLFDLILLTARDPSQEWLFTQRVTELRLQEWARMIRVVADPPGPPPGSGGSTLYALAAALDTLGIDLGRDEPDTATLAARLEGYRLLIIHCGGFSQRLPQFASLGKAFAPIGGAAQGESLLASVVRSLTTLCAGAPSGVVVACGDVLFRGTAPDPFPSADAVAWAWWAPLEQASRHGVYLWDEAGGQATAALQKPSVRQLEDLGFRTQAPLDTGVAFLSTRVTADLLGAAAEGTCGDTARSRVLAARERWQGLDLYGEVIPALVPRAGSSAMPSQPCLQALHGRTLQVVCPPDGEFLHFGTSAELRRILHGDVPASPLLLHSASEDGALDAGAGAVVQYCRVQSPLVVGNGSYVLGLRARCGPAVIGPDLLVYQAPLVGAGSEQRALVVLGISDDPKRHVGVTVMGEELGQWAERRGIAEGDLWARETPTLQRTLWNARLFPLIAPHQLATALDWLQGGQSPGQRWPESPLLSLSEIHSRFDARRWWSYEAGLRQESVARHWVTRLRRDPELPAAEAALSGSESSPFLRRELRRLATREKDSLLAARIWRVCALLAGESEPTDAYQARAFAAIRRGITSRAECAEPVRWRSAPVRGVEVTAPVRVDLAGGWTDTPPQACELGGAVLNLALHLDGRLPVSASASVLSEPVIHLVSRDLGLERRITHPDELRDCRQPGDPFAIHKAALWECGFAGKDARELPRLLRDAGGGLRIETDSGVPKGSGLGTSSILGAAVLASLRYLSGRDTSWEGLFQAVLTLEQRMTTGGGWQDQIGGMLPKIKLTVTEPGLLQVPQVTHVECPALVEQALEERIVLFYTGVPRLAKNVLQRVVSRYLAREPEVRPALRRMKCLAYEMADALRQGDFVRLGEGLRESWELNCLLEPTATHEEIERILQLIAPYCLGWKLAGAGGGGFLFLLARTAADAQLLTEALPRWQPEGRVYRTGLARCGLTITPSVGPEPSRTG